MAKVAWNEYTIDHRREDVETASTYLTIAQRILDVYGREGDSGGPLDESKDLVEMIEADAEQDQEKEG